MPSETSQHTHHIVGVFFRWCKAADDPVEQIGIDAVEQSFESVEPRAVDRLSGSTALLMSERPQLIGSIAQAVRELAREGSWDKNIWSPRPPAGGQVRQTPIYSRTTVGSVQAQLNVNIKNSLGIWFRRI
jgi:hypothetical protein